MKTKFLSVFFLLLLGSFQAFAINDLVVRVPDVYGSKKGYIDNATLVIEPQGVYTEQSLYLEYSDHKQYSLGQKVEVIHRFELPQGAVVNDLWLWIGDSVMKAIVLDTWTARSIYDSIVSMKRDPAFLTKNGNQYELHIYPMDPGNFRKIKISYLTPVLWDGSNARIELPLKMLQSNNNLKKPLNLLFRHRENTEYSPRIIENAGLNFSHRIDTLGSTYKLLRLDDISSFTSLTLQHKIYSMDGSYYKSGTGKDSLNYFQLSLQLKDIFNLTVNSLSKKVIVGLDLSGNFSKDLNILIPAIKNILISTLKPEDEFNIIVSGVGKTKKLSDTWIKYSIENIENILNNFQTSSYADSIKLSQKLNIIFAEPEAQNEWGFNSLKDVANVFTYSEVEQASSNFFNANIIASYREGYENRYNTYQINYIVTCLDSFLNRGGRYINYHDYNREVFGQETVTSRYIKGLKVKRQSKQSETLYRNDSGNIGFTLPESFDHAGTYFFSWTDPDVKVELRDKNGDACIISKKVGKGIIIISGIWSLNDDDGLKKIMNSPILGLTNAYNKPNQLKELLQNIQSEYLVNNFKDAIVISNSDSLMKIYDANNWVTNYTNGFIAKKPIINTINILEDDKLSFPWITYNNTKYIGSGYLQGALSNSTNGSHFELSVNNWNYITTMLKNSNVPFPIEYSITASGDDDTSNIINFRELVLTPVNLFNPKFYVGSTKAKNNVSFSINTKFNSSDSIYSKNLVYSITNDMTMWETVIPSMLGNEKILELFSKRPVDTSSIVRTAIKYNLLCDFTALLALEPNDTLHFMTNYFDESILDVKDEFEIDSLIVSAYPNPFNAETKIMVNVKEPSRVSISVYNILGELVSRVTENEELTGKKLFSWNGKAEGNLNTASGIYFTRIEIVNSNTNQKKVKTIKLMMLK